MRLASAWFVSVKIPLLFALAVLGQFTTAIGQVERPNQEKINRINALLASNDLLQIKSAGQEIKGLFLLGDMPSSVTSKWLPIFVSKQCHDEVIDLSFRAFLFSPDANNVLKLMDWRARALLAMGRSEEALQSAKIAYNVCSFCDTEKAIELVCFVLASNTFDKQKSKQFRLEQAQRSALVASSQSYTSRPLLSSVKIGREAFEDYLEIWKKRTGKFGDRVKYANLLLAIDESQAAEALFRDLRQSEPDQKNKAWAAEGVARALRAEDGCVSRANNWLSSLPLDRPPTLP